MTVITTAPSFTRYIRELWAYRELFLFLAWREILVRYRQTVLGIMWAMIRPIFTMIIFSVIFGRLAKFPSAGIPYPLLVFTALLPWSYFSDTFFYGSNSLIANEQLICKVYFPRMLIPMSYLLCFLVDFTITFFLLLSLSVYYGCLPGVTIIWVPLFFLWNVLFSFSASVLVAALNVRYRDFRHMVPFIIQISLYISPIGFSSTVISPFWRLLYALNPLVGIINGFRWALLGEPLHIMGLLISLMVTVVLFTISFSYFRYEETLFADVI